MPLADTRALVQAVLNGSLDGVSYTVDPVFGLKVPQTAPGVSSRLLQPRETWMDPVAYDAHARRLAGLFRANFEAYAGQVGAAVKQAGPRE
jgi:phosphoenolpyruvate carboxykinase (ATP)